jgi:3-hydroxybutyryl-CoA dehydrogenase
MEASRIIAARVYQQPGGHRHDRRDMTSGFESKHAAVVGGGTMGADIAAMFIAAGWNVEVVEPDRTRWDASLARTAHASSQLSSPLGSAAFSPPAMRARLADVEWSSAAIVIECAPERLALKQSLFSEMEKLAKPGIPLASNSSSFPISDIGRGLESRARMLGLHFFMPAHLIPAVEVIRGEATDAAVCERCAALLRDLGKVPVNVKKDVPGFLANRLQHALAREAFALIQEGLAGPEDIDAAVRYGFGLRYLAAGPVLQKDIAGIDIHCAAAATMYPHLANDTQPAAVLRDKVASGRLGMKSGEGFYRWTPESAARETARYERTLLDALAILRKQ